MALTIEDGTGLATADTYVLEADYIAYAALRGWVLSGVNEINLRRAFDGINRYWRYSGSVLVETQAGQFPRLGKTAVPRAISDAQCELAYLVQAGLDLFATISPSVGGGATERVKVGPIEIEEKGGTGGDSGSGVINVVAVTGLLRPFLYGVSANRLVRG